MSYYELAAENKNYFYFKETVYPVAPHFHSAIEWIFIRNGFQELTVGGEKRVLTAGEGCFCDAFCVHSCAPSVSSQAFVIVCDAYYFERPLFHFSNRTPPKFFRFDDFTLLDTLSALLKNKQSNQAGMVATREGVVSVLLAALAEKTQFVERKKDKQNALVFSVLQYANAHVTEDLSLRKLADVFGYSYEHLSRVLNKSLSENWNAYVNRLRVRLAREYLRKDAVSPVSEIALSCGFENVATFYRAYKKEYGKNPRRY